MSVNDKRTSEGNAVNTDLRKELVAICIVLYVKLDLPIYFFIARENLYFIVVP